MLGEFFAAREDELDEQLLEDGPSERDLEFVEAKALSEVTFATLAEILGLGAYDDLVDRFVDVEWPTSTPEVGAYRLPLEFRNALADLREVDAAARSWAATDELRRSQWQPEEAALVLRELRGLARTARDAGRELWYWWSL